MKNIGTNQMDSKLLPLKTQQKRATHTAPVHSIHLTCAVCENVVPTFDKISLDGHHYHSFCFKCLTCKRTLNLVSYGQQAIVEISPDKWAARVFCKQHQPTQRVSNHHYIPHSTGSSAPGSTVGGGPGVGIGGGGVSATSTLTARSNRSSNEYHHDPHSSTGGTGLSGSKSAGKLTNAQKKINVSQSMHQKVTAIPEDGKQPALVENQIEKSQSELDTEKKKALPALEKSLSVSDQEKKGSPPTPKTRTAKQTAQAPTTTPISVPSSGQPEIASSGSIKANETSPQNSSKTTQVFSKDGSRVNTPDSAVVPASTTRTNSAAAKLFNSTPGYGSNSASTTQRPESPLLVHRSLTPLPVTPQPQSSTMTPDLSQKQPLLDEKNRKRSLRGVTILNEEPEHVNVSEVSGIQETARDNSKISTSQKQSITEKLSISTDNQAQIQADSKKRSSNMSESPVECYSSLNTAEIMASLSPETSPLRERASSKLNDRIKLFEELLKSGGSSVSSSAIPSRRASTNSNGITGAGNHRRRSSVQEAVQKFETIHEQSKTRAPVERENSALAEDPESSARNRFRTRSPTSPFPLPLLPQLQSSPETLEKTIREIVSEKSSFSVNEESASRAGTLSRQPRVRSSTVSSVSNISLGLAVILPLDPQYNGGGQQETINNSRHSSKRGSIIARVEPTVEGMSRNHSLMGTEPLLESIKIHPNEIQVETPKRKSENLLVHSNSLHLSSLFPATETATNQTSVTPKYFSPPDFLTQVSSLNLDKIFSAQHTNTSPASLGSLHLSQVFTDNDTGTRKPMMKNRSHADFLNELGNLYIKKMYKNNKSTGNLLAKSDSLHMSQIFSDQQDKTFARSQSDQQEKTLSSSQSGASKISVLKVSKSNVSVSSGPLEVEKKAANPLLLRSQDILTPISGSLILDKDITSLYIAANASNTDNIVSNESLAASATVSRSNLYLVDTPRAKSIDLAKALKDGIKFNESRVSTQTVDRPIKSDNEIHKPTPTPVAPVENAGLEREDSTLSELDSPITQSHSELVHNNFSLPEPELPSKPPTTVDLASSNPDFSTIQKRVKQRRESVLVKRASVAPQTTNTESVVVRKYKNLLSLQQLLQTSADELNQFYGSLWLSGVNQNTSMNDEWSHVIHAFICDMVDSLGQISAIADETALTTPLVKCQAELQKIIDKKQPYSWPQTTTREQMVLELKQLHVRIRKTCRVILAHVAQVIFFHCKNSFLIPLMEVPGWKIESMTQTNLKTLQDAQSGRRDEFEPDQIELDVQLTDRLRKKKASLQSFMEKAKSADFLSNIKPHYIVQTSKYDPHVSMNLFSDSGALEQTADGHAIVPLDQFDFGALSYRTFFYLQPHRNYIGTIEKIGEVILSMKREPLSNFSSTYDLSNSEYGIRILFRAKSMPGQLVHLFVPESDAGGKSSKKRDNLVEPRDKIWRNAAMMIHPKLDIMKMKEIKVSAAEMETSTGQKLPSKIEKAILQLDEHRTSFNYKFGLLYIKDGQQDENQWFNNNDLSPPFSRFCDMLGDKIVLKGHTGFAGGLDTKNGNTGEKSIFSKWCYDYRRMISTGNFGNVGLIGENELSFEIMYHCSTLLPFSHTDEQQIQRKRHIGNDLVSLVFIDKISTAGDQLEMKTLFDPRQLKSQFLHVYVIVQEIEWDRDLAASITLMSNTAQDRGNSVNQKCRAYRVYCTSVNEVPAFSPSLPDPQIFPVETEQEKARFRDFITAKLINAENAAFYAPKFKSLHTRTNIGLIETMAREFGAAGSKAPQMSSKPSGKGIMMIQKNLEAESGFTSVAMQGSNNSLARLNASLDNLNPPSPKSQR